MRLAFRNIVAAGTTLVLGVILAAGLSGMPAPGGFLPSYGALLSELSISERNALNSVSGVLFDLRGLDTLGEMMIIFIASAGLKVMLRPLGQETLLKHPRQVRPGRLLLPVSETVRAVCFGFASITFIYGVYLTAKGHLTIGGGFQGGVVVATALIFLFLSGRYDIQEEIANDEKFDLADSIGMGGYIVVGLVGLITAGAFLANVLPMGDAGSFLSAGTIPILSILVGVEAFAAVTLIMTQMQEQQLEREGGP